MTLLKDKQERTQELSVCGTVHCEMRIVVVCVNFQKCAGKRTEKNKEREEAGDKGKNGIIKQTVETKKTKRNRTK